jgi:4-hydroxybenzoate polyprenyltransferase
LLASHEYQHSININLSLLAFSIFCLSASGAYLQNDFFDLKQDQIHLKKKRRPLAAGLLTPSLSLWASALLWITAILLSEFFLPRSFLLILVLYMILTLLYSLGLKKIPILDVALLSVFYTLRIISGSQAIGVITSFWLLAFSMFMFSSLALMKRYTELQTGATGGKGYRIEDKVLILNLGISSGLISVLVLALYIQDEKSSTMYANPDIIWAACPVVLFWIAKIWLHAHRGEMHEDPIVFAIKDKWSLCSGLLLVGVFILALKGF